MCHHCKGFLNITGLHGSGVGQGRHTFLDGSYYEGSWANGERLKGSFVLGDGSTEYSGQWRNGVRHGHGVLFQKGLLKYTGAALPP